MNEYTVTVKQASVTEPDAFAGIRRYDEDATVEFSSFDDEGNEIYIIETEANIEMFLDQADGVISYSVSD